MNTVKQVITAKSSIRCGGVNKDNTPCRRVVEKVGDFCKSHTIKAIAPIEQEVVKIPTGLDVISSKGINLTMGQLAHGLNNNLDTLVNKKAVSFRLTSGGIVLERMYHADYQSACRRGIGGAFMAVAYPNLEVFATEWDMQRKARPEAHDSVILLETTKAVGYCKVSKVVATGIMKGAINSHSIGTKETVKRERKSPTEEYNTWLRSLLDTEERLYRHGELAGIVQDTDRYLRHNADAIETLYRRYESQSKRVCKVTQPRLEFIPAAAEEGV